MVAPGTPLRATSSPMENRSGIRRGATRSIVPHARTASTMVLERMPPISLISDSSACLPPEVARRFGIAVLPIVIHLQSADIRDGMEEAVDVVYRSLSRGEAVNSIGIPSVALDLARQLGIRAVFRLNGGAVERLGVPRSAPAALRRIRREALARGLDRAAVRVVFHAANRERADELRELIGGADYLTEFSPSMGIHTGPGVVGVAWLRPASTER